MEKAVNILGALSLALTDEIRAATDSALGTAGETAAAIIMIGAHPGLSIGQVAKALRLTHSGTGRLIDRLASDNLVTRSPATDQRTILLELTEAGQKQRQIALSQRERVLQAAVDHLTGSELETLEGLVHKVLGGVLKERDGQCYRICRMCDEGSCIPNCCPIEERWAELFGHEERQKLP